MLLSILIPVFNAERYVSRCVDSLLHQDLAHEEYEILLMDDGSTDGSYDILNEYAELYQHVQVFRQKNQGPCKARNVLLNKAKGEYIYFIDADDFIAFNSLGKLVNLAKTSCLDVLGFNSMVTSVSENFKQQVSFTEHTRPTLLKGYEYFEQNPFFRLEVWWYLVKTSYLRNSNLLFDENEYNRDVLFTLKIFAKAKRVVHVPVTVHCYFQSENSIMRNKDLSHRRVLIESLYTMILEFTNFISELEKNMTANMRVVIENLKNRRNTFVLFLLAKLVRSDVNAERAKIYLKKLKEIEIYPLSAPFPNEYSIVKRMLVNAMNKEYLLLPAIELTTLQYMFRNSV